MEGLRERLYKRASERKLKLSSEEEDRLLKELNRWLKREGKEQVRVRTEDGSYTLWSTEFGEPYHSITAGALTEAREKFLKPSYLLEKAKTKKVLRILDVGFGLGYNTAVAIHELKRVNPSLRIEVVALDIELLRNPPELPSPYGETHRRLVELIPRGEFEGVSLELLLGDARKSIRNIKGFKADVVFHDPFSPYKNPEMWSKDFLKCVKELMGERGVWVSYTSSLPVRKALLELGFRVGSTPPVGRKRGGTVASLSEGVNNLSYEERQKLEKSPYSIPFRDESLDLSPVDILIDYRLSVLQRERAVVSAG